MYGGLYIFINDEDILYVLKNIFKKMRGFI